MNNMGNDIDAGDTPYTVVRYKNSTILPSFMSLTYGKLTIAPNSSMQSQIYDLEMRVSDSKVESLEAKTF